MRKRSTIGGSALIAAVVGGLLLAACTKAPATPTASGTPAGPARPYGSLTIGVLFRLSTLDPIIAGGGSFQTFGVPVLDSPVELTPEGKPRPGVAERWEISPDGRTHTFYIRKGVKFHDGSDLTGEDVKFSFDRVLTPEATIVSAASWRAAVEKVELKDNYTVVVRMKAPRFDLLDGLEDAVGVAAIVPKKYIEEKGIDYYRQHPVGSGPWKVVKWEPGIRLELEALESHWREIPKFKNITLLNVSELGTKVAMLKTGELDLAEVSFDSVPALKAAGLHTYSYAGGMPLLGVSWYDKDNPQKYAVGDLRVRKAVSLAINRQELADKLLGGFARPTAFYGLTKGAYFYDPALDKPDPYDPEGAKKLLAEAGYPNGFNTKIWDRGEGGILSNLNQAIPGYWRRVGVNAELVPITTEAVRSKYYPKSTAEVWDTFMFRAVTSGMFGFTKMETQYHSTKGAFRNHNNSKVDELIEKVPVTADPAEKKRLAVEFVRLAEDEYIQLAVLDIDTVLAFGPKVGGITPIDGIPAFGASLETITHAK